MKFILTLLPGNIFQILVQFYFIDVLIFTNFIGYDATIKKSVLLAYRPVSGLISFLVSPYHQSFNIISGTKGKEKQYFKQSFMVSLIIIIIGTIAVIALRDLGLYKKVFFTISDCNVIATKIAMMVIPLRLAIVPIMLFVVLRRNTSLYSLVSTLVNVLSIVVFNVLGILIGGNSQHSVDFLIAFTLIIQTLLYVGSNLFMAKYYDEHNEVSIIKITGQILILIATFIILSEGTSFIISLLK